MTRRLLSSRLGAAITAPYTPQRKRSGTSGRYPAIVLSLALASPALAVDTPVDIYYRERYPIGIQAQVRHQERPCGATAPTTIAGSPCEPLQPWVKAVYAPFYGAGLGVRWTLFYGVYAPITTFFRSFRYGIPGGRND